MKRTSSRTLLGLASVVLLIGAAACGDDDDSSSATTARRVGHDRRCRADDGRRRHATTKAATPTTKAATRRRPRRLTPAGMARRRRRRAPPRPRRPPAGPASASGAVAIADSSLGKILVDGKGMTLYMFVPDNQGPSTCVDKCLAAWPALAGPATAGTGVDASKLGMAARPDGTQQATYGGWPLYTFIQDATPGDVNGQDSGEKWYVIGADGVPIKDAS